MSTTKPTRWAQSQINKYLSHQTDDLGKYLREVLLITTDNHYSMDTGKTKEYLLNGHGLDYLHFQLVQPDNSVSFASFGSNKVDPNNNSTQYPSMRHPREIYDRELVNAVMTREYSEELTNLSFTYKDQSNRLWHPIQNIRREYKTQLLADHGLPYQYDINCCAPTLIMRRAHQLGMETWPRAIGEYIQHRDKIRCELAQKVGISERDIKVVINAMFCGARIGNNPEFAIYRLVGTRARVEALRGDPFVQELRADIKECWSYISTTLPRRTTTDKNNRERLLPVSSKQKWSVYFQMERQVLNSVRDYLMATNNPYFLEHDGWTTKYPVDQQLLQQHISNTTGFVITTQLNTLV
jgi:hypothetical protein